MQYHRYPAPALHRIPSRNRTLKCVSITARDLSSFTYVPRNNSWILLGETLGGSWLTTRFPLLSLPDGFIDSHVFMNYQWKTTNLLIPAPIRCSCLPQKEPAYTILFNDYPNTPWRSLQLLYWKECRRMNWRINLKTQRKGRKKVPNQRIRFKQELSCSRNRSQQ